MAALDDMTRQTQQNIGKVISIQSHQGHQLGVGEGGGEGVKGQGSTDLTLAQDHVP